MTTFLPVYFQPDEIISIIMVEVTTKMSCFIFSNETMENLTTYLTQGEIYNYSTIVEPL